jgi:hypothetical protein
MSHDIDNAREIQKEIARTVSWALFGNKALSEEFVIHTAPPLMGYIAARLELGHTQFDFPLDMEFGVYPRDIKAIEQSILRAALPIFEAAGDITILDFENEGPVSAAQVQSGYVSPENILIMAIDELWLDPENKHAAALIGLGLDLILFVQPGTGILSMRVDASTMFKEQGWIIVEKGSIEEDRIVQKWSQDTREIQGIPEGENFDHSTLPRAVAS